MLGVAVRVSASSTAMLVRRPRAHRFLYNTRLTPIIQAASSHDKMKILYYVGFTDWWGAYPPDVLDRDTGKTVGGGEAGALQTAFQLAARGHEVTYLSVATSGSHKGVTFLPNADFHRIYLEGAPWDAVAAWSTPRPLAVTSGEPTLLVQQLNDVAFDWGWWNYTDVLVSPSETHAKAMARYFPPGGEVAQYAVGNGVDLDLFPWPCTPPRERPMQVGWWSSPDRGLHHLLRAWPEIRARVPTARLKVFYQVHKYIQAAQQWSGRATLIANLLMRQLAATERLGVELVDQIPRRALAKEQRQTRVQAYPCDPEGFTEGFATSILESLAAGCLPITRKVDALPELWDGVAWWVETHPLDKGFAEELADKVVRGLTEWSEVPAGPSLEEMRARATQWTWAHVGEEMEKAIALAQRIRAERTRRARVVPAPSVLTPARGWGI